MAVPEAAPEPEPAPPTPEELRAAREAQLLQASPQLVRAKGRLAEVRDDLLSGDAYLRNFTEVARLLTGAGVRFAPIGGRWTRQWVAIAPGQREAVLAACAEAFEGLPVYADLLGHDVTLGSVLAEELPAAVAALEWPDGLPGEPSDRQSDGPSDERAAAETADDQAGQAPDDEPAEPRVRVKGVRIYRPVTTSGGTLVYGAEHGCDLDFWDADGDGRGGVAAIHEPPFGWWVPSLEADAVARIGGSDYPVPQAFVQPRLDDVTFPVDAVITWVDDTDPAWRERRAERLAAMSVRPATGDGVERFRNRDELRYCLRSIAMYAPWIRRIHLVTDGQCPDWLATEHPDVTVVAHQQLFADTTILPVFNSHAIETQIHRIPDLTEHFLYFNDDMFLGRPVRPEQFFQGNGVPLVNLDSRVIPPGPVTADDDEYVAPQKNTRALIRREHGRETSQVLSHTPYPLTRSLLTDCAELFATELAATARSPFRSRSDVAPITLAVGHGYLTGRVAWGRLDHRYLDVDRYSELERLPELLRWRDTDSFCLNDGDLDGVPPEEQDRQVTVFLQDYFPVSGPLERTPPVPAARVPLVVAEPEQEAAEESAEPEQEAAEESAEPAEAEHQTV
ncbi:stealth family protein [Kitasatospora sp. RB6PN24]|uniref:stealth family protein n=1 Tax=Kitasatospora humi TaxID=2893891 RepID=UPI001E4BA3F2|nr:stealth family protein [Kitasatospora humi]MCC9310516.1 stealth family protein [Kitasatospora humi]